MVQDGSPGTTSTSTVTSIASMPMTEADRMEASMGAIIATSPSERITGVFPSASNRRRARKALGRDGRLTASATATATALPTPALTFGFYSGYNPVPNLLLIDGSRPTRRTPSTARAEVSRCDAPRAPYLASGIHRHRGTRSRAPKRRIPAWQTFRLRTTGRIDVDSSRSLSGVHHRRRSRRVDRRFAHHHWRLLG